MIEHKIDDDDFNDWYIYREKNNIVKCIYIIKYYIPSNIKNLIFSRIIRENKNSIIWVKTANGL